MTNSETRKQEQNSAKICSPQREQNRSEHLPPTFPLGRRMNASGIFTPFLFNEIRL